MGKKINLKKVSSNLKEFSDRVLKKVVEERIELDKRSISNTYDKKVNEALLR